MTPASQLDVLVVGAGPTGLTLACQLARFGVRFRIIDKQPDRARESRALGVQARSLEVLQALSLGAALAARGRTTTRLMLHVDRDAPVAIDLGAVPRADTRFPYILFVSQSDTEAVLGGYLEAAGARVERRVELVSFREESTGGEPGGAGPDLGRDGTERSVALGGRRDDVAADQQIGDTRLVVGMVLSAETGYSSRALDRVPPARAGTTLGRDRGRRARVHD